MHAVSGLGVNSFAAAMEPGWAEVALEMPMALRDLTLWNTAGQDGLPGAWGSAIYRLWQY